MRLFIPLNIFALLLLFSLPGTAQNCDCDDGGNCPFPFGANFTGQICYDISDALNDDLSDPSQGVCGVSVTFNHQHIWDLELSLVSPAGQVVPLVGYNTNFFGTTNSVLWNILFIPCANIPLPEPPYEAVWTNNQSWPFAAIIEGSYHPVGGNCLESFNSGPVNGTWCLQIDNQPSPYSGQILNFEVILCDNSGLLCCDADAGELDVQDFAICEGDSSLLIDWEPDFGPLSPDTLEYGYTFVVSDTAGVILLIDTLPDLTAFPQGTYTVCGLSYLFTDSLNIPEPNGLLTVDELLDNLNGAAPWFCGELTETCVTIGIVPPPAPVFLTETICQGDVFMVGDSAVTQSGQYIFLLENAFQCDSVVNLDLTVLEPDSTFLTPTVCFGEVFLVGDSMYTTSGSYITILVNEQGCDSLVFLDLSVLDEIETFLTDTICQGDSYVAGDSLFSLSGNYEVLLTSVAGCDSTVYLDLTVLDPQIFIFPPDTITCTLPAVWLDASTSSAGPGVTYQWTALTGNLALPLDSNQVLATGPGLYELELSEFFCQVRDTVEVLADTLAPVASIFAPDTLTCLEMSVWLDGSASGQGAFLSYQWLDDLGEPIPGATADTLLVDQAGGYGLAVLNAINGCVDTAWVSVAEDLVAPFVDAGPAAELNCLFSSVVLDGSATYQDGDYLFEWEGPGGIPVSWVDSLQAEVTQPGMYYLLATDQGNGCSALDSVEVTQDIQAPVAEAGMADTLTCLTPLLELSGSGSSHSGLLEYFWNTQDGNIVGSPAVANPDADQPGTYILIVTDPQNFCQDTDTVVLFQNIQYPMADAGPTVNLNCLLTTWNLGNPDSTSLGPQYSYIWIGPGGDTISVELSPEIQQGGTYYLYVTDTVNGCTTTDSVFIEQEADLPIAVVGSGGTLTCSDPLILLDGSASTSSPFIEYYWLDPQGNVIGQENQLEVGNAGIFCLVVDNGFNFCADTACVEVFQGAGFPFVDAGPNETLDCLSGQAFLQGAVQPVDPNIVISWSTTTGNILSGADQPAILVDEPGWYVLTADDTFNNCMVVDSAFVVLDTAACLPLVNAGADGLINCYNVPFDTLDASQGTSTGLNITYQWTSIGGTVFNGDNTLFPVVTEGVFILAVTNTALNITATDTVVVFEDLVLPVADAGPPEQVLDCSTISDNYYLDGTGSSQGSQYVYEWSTSGGFIVSGADSLAPLINAPGLYDLQVTNILNGCASTDAILITLDGDLPTPCVATSVQIPCGVTSIVVGDTCFSANTYAYQWVVTGGNLLTDPEGPLVEVEWVDSVVQVSGLIIDTTNQCPVAVQIELFSPLACYPECEIAAPDTLTCDVTAITLDASGSSSGPEFEYAWSAISGSLCGGETTPFPCVDAPGVYRLTVTDTTTQFTCTQDITVVANTSPPPVEAGPVQFLTCETEEVSLQGTEMADVVYQWESEQGLGCILAGAQTPSPLVSCPGSYYLTLTSTLTGCTGFDTTFVQYDTIPPAAALQVSDTLTCATNTVLITSQGSALGSDITYEWFLNDDLIATGLGSWEASVPGWYCLRVVDETTGCWSQACDSLFQLVDPPPVFAGPDTTLTCGITEIWLSGTPIPGQEITVFWTTLNGCMLSDSAMAEVLIGCPGTYFFEATGLATGCSSIDSVVVSANTTPPDAVISSPSPITCLASQVLLNGSASQPAGNISYEWSTSGGAIGGAVDEATAWAEAAGQYQLVVQDQGNQCTDTATVEVLSEVLLPVANAGPDAALSCYFTEITLDGSASSQGAVFTYQWTPSPAAGGDTPFPVIDQPGAYVLTVLDTSNFCIATDTVEVADEVVAPLATITASGAPVITCAQPAVNLSGQSSQPQGMISYLWSTTGGQIQGDPSGEQIFALSEGGYQLIVQNQENGCLDTAYLQVEANLQSPQIVIEISDTLTCAAPQVQLDASGSVAGGPMDVIWSGPGLIGGETTFTPSVNEPGLYFIEVTDQENGCSGQDSVWVVQDTLHPVAQAFADGVLDCETTSLQLSGNGSSSGNNFAYNWTGSPGSILVGANTLFPSVFEPGWYVLTVTNQANGCASSDSVEVLSEGLPITGAELELTLPACFGDLNGMIFVDTVWGGEGPYLFSFEGSGFYPYTHFRYLSAGQYLLEVEDDNGCKFDTLITLQNPNELSVDLGPDQYIQLGEMAIVEAIPNIPENDVAGIQWQPNGDPACADCLYFEVSPPYTTTFVVTIQDENGCTATDIMTIFVEKTSPIYLPTAFSPNGDGENDIFFGQSGPEVAEIELIQIFDRWGNLVFEAGGFPPNDPSYGWDGNFEGRHLDANVFVWQCRLKLADGSFSWEKGDVLLLR